MTGVFNSETTNRAYQQTEPIHDPFVRWRSWRLTLTRLNVITVRVKMKLTTRTLSGFSSKTGLGTPRL
jgi:hypothetical protein